MPKKAHWITAGVMALAWMAWRSRRKPYRLEDRVALITGGSRGLGLLLAHELAHAGTKVAICARDTLELDHARRSLEALGADVLAVPCDITDRAQVERLVSSVLERFGGIDILVNNAGIIRVGPVETMTRADFDETMAVNFRGAVDVTLAALPALRRSGSGRIVNITSIGGRVAVPHVLPYDASKFAMIGFSEGLRAELLRDGILVTTVVPGLMRIGSSLQATYKGDRAAEARWFMASAALPLSAMDPRRAARRIVRALVRGDAHVTLSWQAKLLRLLHDLSPGFVMTLLGEINRLLPAGTSRHEAKGTEVISQVRPAMLRRLVLREGERMHERH